MVIGTTLNTANAKHEQRIEDLKVKWEKGELTIREYVRDTGRSLVKLNLEKEVILSSNGF